MRSNPEHYEYRQAMREGWYRWLLEQRKGEQFLVTLTWSNDKLERPPTAAWLAKTAEREIRRAGLAGVVVVETARGDGRLHVHAVLEQSGLTGGKVSDLVIRWVTRYGFAHQEPITDLMGAVMYLGKAVTAETEWRMLEHAAL